MIDKYTHSPPDFKHNECGTVKRHPYRLSFNRSHVEALEAFPAKESIEIACGLWHADRYLFDTSAAFARTPLSVADIEYRGPFAMTAVQAIVKALEGDLECFPESR